ncbi:hypothetical protein BG003_005275 [Podila horticola]|nr:hypothetical protein BG003_005275 [Podila horticola]
MTCQDVWAHPDKCAFVEAYCSDYPAGLINYLHFYFCDLARAPVAAVLILGTWMVFLFGFVGVAASDFFCPNLSTIAKKLHLSESMTGVTFLAFGNGSPDVFSTFSAMGAGSASLAIGELVGAASFITSVVVGSMAIIKPFKVSKAPFLRDVIFFAGCVLFTLYTVIDGKITMVESITLIVYYIFYVTFVVVGNWYHQRVKTERELEERARNLYDDDEDAEPVDFDEEHELLSNGRGRKQKPPKISTFAVAGPYDAYDDDDEEELDDGYISPSQISSNDLESHQTLVSSMENPDVNMLQHHQLSQNSGGVENAISMRPPGSSVRRRPSLLSAFEFNDVVRSLSLSGSRGRIASYDPSYYGVKSPIHKRHFTRPHSANDASSRAVSVMSTHSQEGASSSSGLVIEHNEIMSTSPMDMDHDADALFEQALLRQSLILPDHHNPANQHLGHVHPHDMSPKDNAWTWKRLTEFLKAVQPIYFPTLIDWDDKTPFIKFLAVTSIPMVFLLTLTLPVVEIKEKEEDDESTDNNMDDTRQAPKIVVEDTDKHKGDEYEGWSRTATTVQMLVAPVFIAAVISSAAEYGVVPVLIALFVGSILSVLIYYSSTEEEPPRCYGALCFVGFMVAITWIFLVANEVVGVLQAFGMIFGVSDAILGLTIFAMGNSLGDLVANITIAKMGFPRMAFSACFGGPLLSISGTYMTLKTGTAIPLQVSPTLFVSLIGVLMTLLAALVIVPRNGYMMGRWWGWFLLIVYLICTVVNVVVEITMSKED